MSSTKVISQVVKDTIIDDYNAIDKLIQENILKYSSNDVLVVLDIDNTVLVSENDLGSDFWYQWQNDELEIKPTKSQKLSQDCLYDEAIGLLYELGTMRLTDTILRSYLSNWQKMNVTIFALTSRSPKYRAATERELKRNAINFSISELNTKEGNKMNINYKLKRDLSYHDGIFMTSGMNKGEMLSHILGKSGKNFKSVIFVDDSKRNITAVKETSSLCTVSNLTVIHYTKILNDRLKANGNTIFNQQQIEKMHSNWKLLIQTLNSLFPKRIIATKCN